MLTKTIATKIVIKVNGFHDAKDWMYRILRAGITTCSSCDKTAVRIWWNDAAEWYYECGDHYTDKPMWGGHTRWRPDYFDKRVFPDLARAWVATLPPEEQACIRFREYDATDYYSLLTEDYWKEPLEVQLSGDRDDWGWFVRVLPLRTGDYVYELEHKSPNYSHMYGLVGAFASVDEAIAAAKQNEVIAR